MHYINHSDTESHVEWKILIMNNHESHVISKFIVLINYNHICSLTLISHLTHCMQYLNVGIFVSYKNWHNTVIVKIVSESFIEYSLTHFLNDLIWIRNQTFKKTLIDSHLKNAKFDHLTQVNASIYWKSSITRLMRSQNCPYCVQAIKSIRAFSDREKCFEKSLRVRNCKKYAIKWFHLWRQI
jgi:hypothetical protein